MVHRSVPTVCLCRPNVITVVTQFFEQLSVKYSCIGLFQFTSGALFRPFNFIFYLINNFTDRLHFSVNQDV